MSWLPAAVSIFGSLFGGQSGGNAAANNQNAIDQWLIPMLQKEATQGLDPAFVNAMIGDYQSSGLSDIASMRNQLGAGNVNPAGLQQDELNQLLQGRVKLGSDLAAENQQFKNQALQELAGIGGQYGQEASSMGLNNPYQSIASALASIPSGSGGSGGGIGQWISRMFGHGSGSGAVNFGPITTPVVPGMNGPNILPGLGIPIPSTNATPNTSLYGMMSGSPSYG